MKTPKTQQQQQNEPYDKITKIKCNSRVGKMRSEKKKQQKKLISNCFIQKMGSFNALTRVRFVLFVAMCFIMMS